MSDSPEKRVQDTIFAWLVSQGALVIRVNSGAMVQQEPGRKKRFIRFVTWRVLQSALNSAGVSDLLACLNGRFVAIECKAPGKLANVSAAQRMFLDAVEQAGGVAMVADRLGLVEEQLNASGVTAPSRDN